jgi:hypothetical protein
MAYGSTTTISNNSVSETATAHPPPDPQLSTKAHQGKHLLHQSFPHLQAHHHPTPQGLHHRPLPELSLGEGMTTTGTVRMTEEPHQTAHHTPTHPRTQNVRGKERGRKMDVTPPNSPSTQTLPPPPTMTMTTAATTTRNSAPESSCTPNHPTKTATVEQTRQSTNKPTKSKGRKVQGSFSRGEWTFWSGE